MPSNVAVTELSARALPRSWRRYPAPASLQRFGNEWLDRNSACVLRIPSALVPSESNFLINPAHPDARKLRVVRKAGWKGPERVGNPSTLG